MCHSEILHPAASLFRINCFSRCLHFLAPKNPTWNQSANSNYPFHPGTVRPPSPPRGIFSKVWNLIFALRFAAFSEVSDAYGHVLIVLFVNFAFRSTC